MTQLRSLSHVICLCWFLLPPTKGIVLLHICMISGLRREVHEDSALLIYYIASGISYTHLNNFIYY